MSFRALSSVQHVLLPLYYMRTFVNSLSWAPNRGIPIKSIQYHLSYQENPVSGFLSPHDARFDFRRVDRSLSDISCIQHTYYEQANPNVNSKKPILYGYVRCSYLHLFPSRLELCTPIRMLWGCSATILYQPQTTLWANRKCRSYLSITNIKY